ncbi:SDR family oxidoreductase [Pikeienuella piscinae]|uniref:SDR family oxidoreductase n=1 Tax=Pikeienuella piscinae TaxID=2748098 RepID=A0A7L5BWZ1_9RHOB|nr:SDR family oxidoreductase [Pikeienuella piscinae]QIE56425.1 SDR family oxidoreductase [Pikeienuella piscinae]
MPEGTALVTGASAGIGAATVRALVTDGWAVHMTARRAERLATLAKETGATAHAIDIRDHARMRELVEQTQFDLLVANAGKGAAMTALEDAAPADIAELIEINVTAQIQLVGAILPGMAARGRGHVVTLGSVAGLYATGAALYSASKHAVRGFVRNMRLDQLGKGVRFTDIQPGRVRTEFYDVAVKDAGKREAIKETGIEELQAEDVAEAIRWVAALPAHVNISALEITPTDQAFGGVRLAGR